MTDAEIAENTELAAVRVDVAMGRSILPSVACRVLAFLDRCTAERDAALATRANDIAVIAAAMRLRPEWLAEDVTRAAAEWTDLSAHHDQHHQEERLLRERIVALTTPDTTPCPAPDAPDPDRLVYVAAHYVEALERDLRDARAAAALRQTEIESLRHAALVARPVPDDIGHALRRLVAFDLARRKAPKSADIKAASGKEQQALVVLRRNADREFNKALTDVHQMARAWVHETTQAERTPGAGEDAGATNADYGRCSECGRAWFTVDDACKRCGLTLANWTYDHDMHCRSAAMDWRARALAAEARLQPSAHTRAVRCTACALQTKDPSVVIPRLFHECPEAKATP